MDITKYSTYFEKMKVGERLQISKSKDPDSLVAAGKLCIDLGSPLIFSNDYSELIKLELFEFPPEKTIFL